MIQSLPFFTKQKTQTNTNGPHPPAPLQTFNTEQLSIEIVFVDAYDGQGAKVF